MPTLDLLGKTKNGDHKVAIYVCHDRHVARLPSLPSKCRRLSNSKASPRTQCRGRRRRRDYSLIKSAIFER